MFKPTRGPSKPTLKSSGINQLALVKFLQDCEDYLLRSGDQDGAFRVEMIKTYFKEDYEEGKPLKFSGQVVGM